MDNDSAAEVTEAVAFLRAFGRARSLSGSESPVFARMAGLKVPKKTATAVVQALERALIATPPGEDFAMGTTSGALQASQGARKHFPMAGVPIEVRHPSSGPLHWIVEPVTGYNTCVCVRLTIICPSRYQAIASFGDVASNDTTCFACLEIIKPPFGAYEH